MNNNPSLMGKSKFSKHIGTKPAHMVLDGKVSTVKLAIDSKLLALTSFRKKLNYSQNINKIRNV